MLNEEWHSDSGGVDFLTEDKFYDAIFSVADMWTDDTLAATYVRFLDEMLDVVRGVGHEAAMQPFQQGEQAGTHVVDCRHSRSHSVYRGCTSSAPSRARHPYVPVWYMAPPRPDSSPNCLSQVRRFVLGTCHCCRQTWASPTNTLVGARTRCNLTLRERSTRGRSRTLGCMKRHQQAVVAIAPNARL